MGIHFRCHLCGAELNVKEFQGGKRGKCPSCRGLFRIPLGNAETSLDVHERPGELASEQLVTDGEQPVAGSKDLELADLPLVPFEAEKSEEIQAELPPASNSPLANSQQVTTPPASAPPSPDSSWLVRLANGGQYGPATTPVIEQWLQEKRIAPDSMVWRNDWPAWRPALDVFGDFFEHVGLSSGPPPVAPTAPATEAAPGIQVGNEKNSAQQGSPSLGQVHREDRKRRRQRNYTILIAALIVLFVGLAATLVVVLWRQGQG